MNGSHKAGSARASCSAFGITIAVLVAASIVPVLHARQPDAPTFRCAVHPASTYCYICDDCTTDSHGVPQCGTIIGGITCQSNMTASCTVTDTGWTATCVTSP